MQKKTLIKVDTIKQFEKLKNIFKTKIKIENDKYLKTIEWAGKKFYRNMVEEVIKKPNQTIAKLNYNFNNKLMTWEKRDGLIYLMESLKNSISTLDSIEKKQKIVKNNFYYQMATKYRDRKYNDFIKQWAEAAKNSFENDINNVLKIFLPKDLFEAYNNARKELIKQSEKILSLRTQFKFKKKLKRTL